MNVAVLFPGQGSQKVGMGLDLLEKSNLAKELFQKVDSVSKRELSKVFLYGPESDLNQTKNTQPSIFIVSVLLTMILEEEFKKRNLAFQPKACCGHSLGEFSALWFSKAFLLEDLIKLVNIRGNLMQNAPPGAMAAVLNLSVEQIKETLASENLNDKIVIANYNSPSQFVISGEKDAVSSIVPKFKSAGGKTILLPVSGAFHSPLMNAAAKEFANSVDQLPSNAKIHIPVFQNVDGKPSTDISEMKAKTKNQMTSCVYWSQTINNLYDSGVGTVVEIGPGKVLTGLTKKINPNIECHNIFDYASLMDFVSKCEAK